MAKYLVQKSGPLNGYVTISGAKNAVLPLMAAGLLAEEQTTIKDVPALRDVAVLREVMNKLGSDIEQPEEGVLNIQTKEILSTRFGAILQ